jgi:predicted Zn-dependent protease
MYRFILTAVVVFIAAQAFSQSKPPKKIRKALLERYPDAEIVKSHEDWEMKGKSKQNKTWKILFKHDGGLSSSEFDSKGNWTQTKTKISEDELPEAVKKTIEEYYYMYNIVIVARFENLEAEGYEVFLDNGNDGFDIQFSEDGEVLSRIITSKGYRPIDDDGNFK